MESIIHLSSPLLYILFVHQLNIFTPCPSNKIMLTFRKLHNINLSLLSGAMLIGITIATYQENKFHTLNALLCKSNNNNIYAKYSTQVFLYSKYLEWLDTLFVHLSNKPIIQLQYTHHMSTAILVYLNTVDYISPSVYIYISQNCLIHIFMYWYFAYPKGILYKYRKLITQGQIVQHVICLTTSLYTYNLENCTQNTYGNIALILLYLMYLVYFVQFYSKTYFIKISKNI